MKNARTGMSARYLAALRAHLRRKRQDDGDRAQGLGRVALAGGLVPRDLALMHAQAVLALAASEGLAHAPVGSTAHVAAMTRAGFFSPRRSFHWKRPSGRRGRRTGCSSSAMKRCGCTRRRWRRATAGSNAKSRGARRARRSSAKSGRSIASSMWNRRSCSANSGC